MLVRTTEWHERLRRTDVAWTLEELPVSGKAVSSLEQYLRFSYVLVFAKIERRAVKSRLLQDRWCIRTLPADLEGFSRRNDRTPSAGVPTGVHLTQRYCSNRRDGRRAWRDARRFHQAPSSMRLERSRSSCILMHRSRIGVWISDSDPGMREAKTAAASPSTVARCWPPRMDREASAAPHLRPRGCRSDRRR
ncbi:hypothetical protein BH18ACI5_BH18ACI5_01400 [soil metagenome]